MSAEPSRSFPTAATGSNRSASASLYKLLAHRKRVQSAEGLQAHCNALRQVGPKLFGLRLPCSSPGMVDLMSRDP
jgi:hypothetical protein